MIKPNIKKAEYTFTETITTDDLPDEFFIEIASQMFDGYLEFCLRNDGVNVYLDLEFDDDFEKVKTFTQLAQEYVKDFEVSISQIDDLEKALEILNDKYEKQEPLKEPYTNKI